MNVYLVIKELTAQSHARKESTASIAGGIARAKTADHVILVMARVRVPLDSSVITAKERLSKVLLLILKVLKLSFCVGQYDLSNQSVR